MSVVCSTSSIVPSSLRARRGPRPHTTGRSQGIAPPRSALTYTSGLSTAHRRRKTVNTTKRRLCGVRHLHRGASPPVPASRVRLYPMPSASTRTGSGQRPMPHHACTQLNKALPASHRRSGAPPASQPAANGAVAACSGLSRVSATSPRPRALIVSWGARDPRP